jgi:hypothetical protein
MNQTPFRTGMMHAINMMNTRRMLRRASCVIIIEPPPPLTHRSVSCLSRVSGQTHGAAAAGDQRRTSRAFETCDKSRFFSGHGPFRRLGGVEPPRLSALAPATAAGSESHLIVFSCLAWSSKCFYTNNSRFRALFPHSPHVAVTQTQLSPHTYASELLYPTDKPYQRTMKSYSACVLLQPPLSGGRARCGALICTPRA